MKIYTRVEYEWDEKTQQYKIVDSDSYEYEGPVAQCGKGGGGSQQAAAPSTSTVQSSQLPPWAEPYYNSMMNRAQDVSTQAYPTYNGPRVQDLTSGQQQANDLASGYGTAGQQVVGGIPALLQNAGQTWNNNIAQQYMSPYQQNVTGIALQELQRQGDINQQQLQGQQQQSGAYGGYRAGLQSAEAQRNLEQVMAQTAMQGQNAAYQNAQNMFGQDASRQLQTALGTGQIASQGIAGLGQTGGVQQATGQQALNTSYQDYMNQQLFPMQQLSWLSGIMGGVPVQPSINTTTYLPQPNIYSQVAGLGLGAAALGKMTG